MAETNTTEIKYTLDGEEYTAKQLANFPTMNVERNWQIDPNEVTIPELANSNLNVALTFYKAKVEDAEDSTMRWYLALTDAKCLFDKKLRDNKIDYLEYQTTSINTHEHKSLFLFSDIKTLAINSTHNKWKYTAKNSNQKFDINVLFATLLALPGLDVVIQEYIQIGGDGQVEKKRVSAYDYPTNDEIATLVAQYTTENPQLNEQQLTAYHDSLHQDRAVLLENQSKVLWFGLPTTDSPIPANMVCAQEYTTIELQFISSLILLCSMKTFSANVDHFTTYAAKRCGAFASHMNNEDLSWSSVEEKIDSESILEVASKITFYPKFRRMLYCSIINSDKQWATFCKPMLEDSQMTTFNFIYIFLRETPITKAHFLPMVQDEIRGFIASYTVLKKRYGPMIRFAKLINPNDSSIQTSRWPTLSALSVCSAYINTAETSLYKYKIKKRVGANIIRLLSFEVNSKYVKDGTGTTQWNTEELDFMNLSSTLDITSTDLFNTIDTMKLQMINDYITKSQDIN